MEVIHLPSISQLKKAIEVVIFENLVLRTNYHHLNGKPFQVVHESLGPDFVGIEALEFSEGELGF